LTCWAIIDPGRTLLQGAVSGFVGVSNVFVGSRSRCGVVKSGFSSQVFPVCAYGPLRAWLHWAASWKGGASGESRVCTFRTENMFPAP
jgi:hypothetical protein